MIEEADKSKILKYLILSLVIVSCVILIKGVILKPKEIVLPEVPSQLPLVPVKIDFEFLKKMETQEFLPFERLSLPEEVGRINPFEPY